MEKSGWGFPYRFIMQSKKIWAPTSVVFVAFFFCAPLFSFEVQEKNRDESKQVRLIRMDLLKQRTKEMKLPATNIFTGRREESLFVSGNRGIPGTDRPANGLGQKSDAQIDEREGRNPGTPGFNLKYLGYVASLEKKVALILYNGEFLAVEKGYVLPGGIEVIEITSGTVTVKGLESEKIVLKLEGEKK